MLLPDTTQTIVAPASAPGSGAIAVVRLSGPGAFRTAAAFLKPSSVVKNPKNRFSYLLSAEENGRLLDKTIVVFYRGPESYTGEDMVEISCHGSPYIVSRLLSLSIAGGAREAGPGEFTLRAFMNGKLDLAQAEAVNDLIISEGETAHRAAITQVEGGISKRIKELRGALITMLGELEVRLDDSYNELGELDIKAFTKRTAAIAGKIKALADSFKNGRYLKHGIRVTIAGAPNSGKSSLLNRITGSGRAIVSPKAGTTRDTIEAKLTLSGFTVIFTDTAGINPRTSDAIEREGMRRSLKALKTADIILWVQDASKKSSPADRRVGAAIERGSAPGTDLVKVFNKGDLPGARTPSETADGTAISCRTGEGIAALKRLLIREEKKIFSTESSSVITSARHYSALLNSHRELEKIGLLGTGRSFPLELAAEHLRGTLTALAGILGETASEEILASIFKNFCVGK
ncbi:MAG: tRNA uridine-5-carboxymethylaminomethyl(34) synthesis GTPase MnmE [Elusimicrobia bacterium RIFOXYA12_FULL_51_18]|nr:MAG: tRNA uridine-5-carboxymethylaminomethyl(34) synthesis GTPase MnmE [Elusimicrobia bacterium RIFOXYA12_FULL_51_18]OGS29467.1 MAG: tRNA uridine-5-carboxymethylaminomethyl(34) synthesis GTPase MnmE [Elusimicrobia bacterium RIFOXYA2_FULL_53_38]